MNSKAVAMDIYRQTRDRTAVIDLIKEGSLYKRCDVIQTVVDCVGRNKISSVGQLENNLSWEVVFTDVAAKDVFVGGNHKVKGHDAVVRDLRRSARRLRIQRVPRCVPNEFLVHLLSQRGIKVISITYETDKIDGLPSNVRSVMVDTNDWDNVPDLLPWSFDGFQGVALIFLQGRPARCYRCRERGHKFFDCPHPYCRRCRTTGHMESEDCASRRSYAQTITGARADPTTEDMDLQDEEEQEVETNQPEQQERIDWYEQTVREEQQHAETANADSARQQDTTTSTAVAIALDSDTADDDEPADGVDGDDESGTAADNDSFRKPISRVQRQSRSKKRAVAVSESSQLVVSGSDMETTTKKSRKLSEQMSDVELDPTSGRRHSRTRVCSGRHKDPIQDTATTASVSSDKTV